MSNKKQPPKQTVTQQAKLPGWVNQAGKDSYRDVFDLTTGNASKDFVNPFANPNDPRAGGVLGGPYMGTMVGPQSPDTLAAYDAVRANAFGGTDTVNAGVNAVRGAINPGNIPQVGGATTGFERVGAGNFLQGNINAYMDPYIQNVENRALENIDRARLTSLNQTADAARAAGAFGGSRQGVREGVTNAEAARAAGDMSASLRSKGFEAASGLMTADMNRELDAARANQGVGFQSSATNANLLQQGQTANQNAAVEMARTGVQGGSILGQLGTSQQGMGLQGAAALQGSGSAQEAYANQLLAERARLYETFRQAPFEQPNVRQQFLQGTPYGSTTQTTGPATTQGYNPLLGGLGGAGTGLSIANALNTAGAGVGTGGALGLGGLGALVGLFSDRNEKTDIQKVGRDKATGLNMFAYRYKGDPKSYPKVVGPMAQDVERAHPGSTTKVGGKRVIRNLGFGGAR